MILMLIGLAHAEIGGHVLVEYNTVTSGGIGEVQVHKDIGRWRIGTILRTNISAFKLKEGVFPAGVPESQYFDLFVRYRTTYNFDVYLRSWCTHYFRESDVWWRWDQSGLNLGFKYEF